MVFLHHIQEGPANRSFGLQVAKLAGVPGPVLVAAQEKLTELERDEATRVPASIPQPAQVDLFGGGTPHPVVDILEALDIDALSPRQALEQLYELKAKVD